MLKMLPSFNRSVTIDYTGQTTGTRYQGTFEFKVILDAQEELRMEGLATMKLLGQIGQAGAGYQEFARSLATLQVSILKSPDWWSDPKQLADGEKVYDPDLIAHLRLELRKAKLAWQEDVGVKAKKAEESNDKKPEPVEAAGA